MHHLKWRIRNTGESVTQGVLTQVWQELEYQWNMKSNKWTYTFSLFYFILLALKLRDQLLPPPTWCLNILLLWYHFKRHKNLKFWGTELLWFQAILKHLCHWNFCHWLYCLKSVLRGLFTFQRELCFLSCYVHCDTTFIWVGHNFPQCTADRAFLERK
jgi:hypothetical protein